MGYNESIDSREKLIRSLGETLEEASYGCIPYIDLTSQTIDLHVPSEYTDIDEDEGLNGHEIVDIKSLKSYEGYSIMEQFAQSRNAYESDKLFRALSRRHPFRTFRSEVEYLGILQEWYDFKSKAYEEFAEERLFEYEVDFVDGRIVCTNPDNIRVVGDTEGENDFDLDDDSDDE